MSPGHAHRPAGRAAVRITRWDFPPGGVTGWHEHG
ncbi:cupin, partial [Methylobacterium radiotolerans]